MEQFLAILVVALVAAAFYGISYFRKKKIYPDCDRFALQYCRLSDRLLDEGTSSSDLAVDMMSGGLYQIRPIEQQPEGVRNALQKAIDQETLDTLRELFLLRNEIQSKASNGSLAKDKYNAITNQIYESLHTFLSIVKDPTQFITQKELDYFNYFLLNQKHIRNVTLAAIVSRACAEQIAL